MKKLLAIALLTTVFLVPGCGSDKSTQAPVPSDDAPPLVPTGIAWQVEKGNQVVLTWTPNSEPDLAGYRVYFYDPSPHREEAYVLQNPDNLLPRETWVSAIQYGQTLWVRVTAVDDAGNESASSRPRRVTWQPGPPEPPEEFTPPKPPGQQADEGRPTVGR